MSILVSEKDKFLLFKHRWFISSSGYAVTKIEGKLISLHRLIMEAKTGQEIDHINRNKLDNRRSNLRFSNRYAQMKNARYKVGKCGVLGVKANYNKWIARRRVNGKRIYLGSFNTTEEAQTAYEQMG